MQVVAVVFNVIYVENIHDLLRCKGPRTVCTYGDRCGRSGGRCFAGEEYGRAASLSPDYGTAL